MSPLVEPTFTFRRLVYYSLGCIAAAGFVWYVLFQARFLVAGPQLTLTSPETPLSTERTVTLSGQAANIVELTLNGRPIYTDTTGIFTETLVLENGYTTATLRARDRYGRIVTERRSFVYQPPLTDNL